jgi:hypothetical protein
MPKPQRPWKVTAHDPIEKLEENLWAVNGKIPGVPMHRRMCIVKRSDGRLLFFHAIPLDDKALAEVTAWGKPAFLVVGHDQHAVDADAFSKRLGLKIFGPKEKDAQLRDRIELAGHLEDLPADPAVSIEAMAGTKSGEPVMIVRSAGGQRVSLLFCDAIHNNHPDRTSLILRLLGFAGGLKVNPVFKLLFMSDRTALRAHLEKLAAVLGLTRLVPCHGDILTTDVPAALRAAAARL